MAKKHLDISYWRNFPIWGEEKKNGQEYFCNFISYQNDIDVLVYKGHSGYCCFIFEQKKLIYECSLLGYFSPQKFAENAGFWEIHRIDK